MYDVIILGAGPAGLSAAVYAKRARLNALLIEKGGAGGQVLSTYEVDNYPGLPGVTGMELGQIFSQHADKFGIEKVTAEVIAIAAGEGKKIVKTNQGDYETAAVIIATGAKHARLGLEKENELTGMGVSYCATCDGAFYKDAEVAVVGGGDVAIEDAIFLARGCKKVYLIHRRDELRGAKALQETLFALPNVEVIWDSVVREIEGEDEVTGIRVANVKSGEERNLPVEGLFIAVGIIPNSEAFEGLVSMDKGGYIVAGEDCKTDIPGIFAAGDVRTKPLRQIVTAAADGANAIYSVQEYLIHG
ncbi:MAG: thioredoxin-disulfide reductase [Lachnospiraceae bacterium]|nr:thioredoxin-disulfide reductase [Lachnospiraceae bacterium]